MKSRLLKTRYLIVAIGIAALIVSGCGRKDPAELVTSAKHFMGKGDNKSAVIQLKSALQAAPRNAEARFLLGELESRSGELAAAEHEFRKAKAYGYPADEVVPRLARAMLARGKSKQIIDQFSSSRLKDARAFGALKAIVGYAYLETGKPKKAEAAFLEALKSSHGQVQASLGMAMLLAGKGNVRAAMQDVDNVLSKAPTQVEALMLKGRLLASSGDRAGAFGIYGRVVEAHPNNVRAHYARAILALEAGKSDVATRDLAVIEKLAPRTQASSYLHALLAFKQRNFVEAHDAVEQVLGISPSFAPGQLLAGEVAMRLGAYAEAVTHLEKAMTLSPHNEMARRLLTVAYLKANQPKRALGALKPMLESQEASYHTLLLAGDTYLYNDDLSMAQSYFRKASAMKGPGAEARIRLGQTYLAEGNTSLGMKQLEAAAAADPTQYQADVLLIEAHLRRGERKQALQDVAKLEKKQPKSPLPYFLRSRALLLGGKRVEARRSLERALALDHTYFPAALALAKLDLQEKRWKAAEHEFDGILSKEPNSLVVLLALAQVKSYAGAAQKDVLELLNRAIKMHPESVEARLAKVRYYLMKKRPQRAVDASVEARTAIPGNPAILSALGASQLAAGNFNQAITAFSQVRELQPRSAGALLQLAVAQHADKQNRSAIESLQKALTLSPNLLNAQVGLIRLYMIENRTKEALKIARDIQSQRPELSLGYTAKGDIFARGKDWAKAAAAYRAGLDKVHSWVLAVKLADALRADGQNREAQRVTDEWLRGHPKNTSVRSYLAERDVNERRYTDAAKQYKSILKIDPKSALALNNLAWVSDQLGEVEAVRYAERANTLAPNTPAILDTLAMILAKNGKPMRAIGLLHRAVDLSPGAWKLRIDLGRVLVKAGQGHRARRELEPLLKLQKNDPARIAAEEVLSKL